MNPAEAEELIRQRDAARSAASVAEAERLVAQNEVVKFGYRAMDAQKERDAAVAVVRGAFPWMMALAAGSSTQAAAAAGAWLDSFKQLRLPSDADAALRAMRGAAPAVLADERIALESAGVAHQLVEAIRERDEARSERDGAQAAVVLANALAAQRLVLLKDARDALDPWIKTHDQACTDERAARRERDVCWCDTCEVRRLRHALATFEAQHTPWPLADFVKRLADGADHLLNDHACDAHGYESLNAARDAARAWLEARSTTTRKETER